MQYVLLLGSIIFVFFIVWIVFRRYIRNKEGYRELFADEQDENSEDGIKNTK